MRSILKRAARLGRIESQFELVRTWSIGNIERMKNCRVLRHGRLDTIVAGAKIVEFLAIFGITRCDIVAESQHAVGVRSVGNGPVEHWIVALLRISEMIVARPRCFDTGRSSASFGRRVDPRSRLLGTRLVIVAPLQAVTVGIHRIVDIVGENALAVRPYISRGGPHKVTLARTCRHDGDIGPWCWMPVGPIVALLGTFVAVIFATVLTRSITHIVPIGVLASTSGPAVVVDIAIGGKETLVAFARIALFVVVIRLVDSIHGLTSSVQSGPDSLVTSVGWSLRIAK